MMRTAIQKRTGPTPTGWDLRQLALSDDVVASIDIDGFSSDQLGVISRKAGRRHTDILDTHERGPF